MPVLFYFLLQCHPERKRRISEAIFDSLRRNMGEENHDNNYV